MFSKRIKSYFIATSIVLVFPLFFLFSFIRAQQGDDTLKRSWESYKSTYISPDGAVRRLDQGNDVVSEGVSYALLRAVMVDDQETFDKVYGWSEQHLSRTLNPSLHDNLLAWKYTDQVADWGAASDADLDYALALAFASKKWNAPTNSNLPGYAAKSIAVQKDILKIETGRANGKLYLQPGSWNQFNAPIVVNPSYLSPAHYKIFNQMQPDERWNELVGTAYEILWKSSSQIDGTVGVGFPANWVLVKEDGSVSKSPQFDINYTYDAFRTSFRVTLDYVWFNDERAKNYLTISGAKAQLLREFGSSGKISAEYLHNGEISGRYDNAGVYGVNVGWFIPENKDVVEKFVSKIEDEYSRNGGKFLPAQSYYMENWAWFGLALGTGQFTNIYAGDVAPIPTSKPTNIIGEIFTSVIGESVESSPSGVSSAAPQATTDPSATEYLTGLHILSPTEGSSQTQSLTVKVFNDSPQTYGTWWSVDSGSWVAMDKTDAPYIWKADIDLSGWQWSNDHSYIVHAWTMDSNQQVKHTQTVIKVK